MENNKEFKNKDHYEDNMICEENSDDLLPDVMEIDKEKTSLRTNLTWFKEILVDVSMNFHEENLEKASLHELQD